MLPVIAKFFDRLADVVEGLVYRLDDGGLLALGGQQPQRQPPALEGVQSDNLPEPDSTEAGWGSSAERAAGVDAAPLRLPRDSIFPNDQLSPQSWTPRAVPTEDGLSEEEEKVEAPESSTPSPSARPAEDLNGGETVFTPARVVSDWDKERLEAARARLLVGGAPLPMRSSTGRAASSSSSPDARDAQARLRAAASPSRAASTSSTTSSTTAGVTTTHDRCGHFGAHAVCRALCSPTCSMADCTHIRCPPRPSWAEGMETAALARVVAASVVAVA